MSRRTCRVTTAGFDGCSPVVGERIQRWMRGHVLKEVVLKPVPDRSYYAIYLNGLPDPVPGVVLAAEDLEDPGVLEATLEAAWRVFDHETARQG